eukprot:scaffold113_cov339-Pavlova_lutheri.AAC.5
MGGRGHGQTHYQVIGASPDASQEQLRKAYLQQACQKHPDRHEDPIGAHGEFQKLQEAWENLKTPEKRHAYDKQLERMEMCTRIAVAEQIDLDDMESTWCGARKTHAFRKTCRCGGTYLLWEDEMNEEQNQVVVGCELCSLHVQIHYAVMEEGRE